MASFCRPSKVSARWQLIGVFGGIVLAGTGCGSLAPRTPATMSSARGWVRTIAGAPLPAQLPACSQLEDATRLWATAEAPALVTAFLRRHVPAETRNSVQGGSTSAGRPTSFVVVDDASRRSRDGKLIDTGAELIFTFAGIDSRTGLRVDAVTVPKGADCLGGGASG